MSPVRWWRDVSISRKLYFVVGIMATLIVCELLTLQVAMHTLSAARAFVGGEGLWSKSQKNATISLQRYGRTRLESDYESFLKPLIVNDGDHQARLELLKASPNLDIVREGFLRGRLHPDDIDPMIQLIQRFHWTPYLSRALLVWEQADGLLAQFKKAGVAYHDAVVANDSERAVTELNEITRLNDELTVVENEFSYLLGAGSRQIEFIVLALLSIAVFLVEAFGLTLMFLTSRSISRGLRALNEAAIRLEQGDFSAKLIPQSNDEIGQVAHAVNRMGQALQQSYAELEARVKDRTLELAASRDQLNVILGGITDGVSVIDDEGRFVYVNETGAKMCGLTVEQMLSTPQKKLFENIEVTDEAGNPFPLNRLPSKLAFAGIENPPEVMIRFRLRHTGAEGWSLLKSAPVLDHARKTKLVVTIFKDFTSRKRSEDALKFLDEASTIFNSSLGYEATLQSLARFLVPQYADCCWLEILEDGELKQVALSHADPTKNRLAEPSGQRRASAPHSTVGSAHVLRTGRPQLLEHITEEMLEGSSLCSEQIRIPREVRVRSAIVVPLIARQKVLGALTVAWSTSKKKYCPGDVPPMEELGRRAGIAVDNARLYREAQDAIRVRDDFLAIAGHELKTPLTALLMAVQGSQRVADREGVNLTERLERASRSGVRLERLIDQLLDVSKISAGKLHLEPEMFELGDVLNEVAARFLNESIKTQCPISVEISQKFDVTWDRLRIEQVLTNLLGNAVKYGQGKPIDLALLADGDCAVIRVTDRGIGIDSEDQKRIFERFERAVASRKFGGFGLGLWITRQIVEAIGGTIAVDSAPGQGATFTVRIPANTSRVSDATR